MKVLPVPTRPADASFDEVFEQFVSRGRPLVLRGAALGWPCMEKWTASFFRGRYGDAPADFVDVRTGERKVRSVGAYFDLGAGERERWYLVDWDFRRAHPELREDIRVPPQLDVDWIGHLPPRARPELLWIYIGHAGTYGPTHLDNFGTSAWLAVVVGEKRVRFAFPTDEAPESLGGFDLFADLVDPPFVLGEASLTAGDVLYVPAGAWHAARNDTECISVTGNFVDGACLDLHRRFQTRDWHGPRMLHLEMRRLWAMQPGPERHRLARHLALALERVRDELAGELAELAALAAHLDRRVG